MRNTLSLYFLLSLLLACSPKEKSQQNQETPQPIKRINSPAGENSETPSLINGAYGNLYLSWLETDGEGGVLQYARWEGAAWSAPEVIAKGDDWFVNWADYPTMAVNKNGDKVAHYLQMSDTGTYTYDVKVVAKKLGEADWSKPVKLHSDTVRAEHGFVSMQPMTDGNFFMAWLDGRNTTTIMEAGHDHSGHGGRGAMTIRGAVLTPGLEVTTEAELDNRVCDCCQTSAALTDQGPVVVYRDRSPKEVRDISIVRRIDGEWTKPKTVHNDNWEIAGCPVNGPKVVAYDKKVAVAWFTGAGDEPKVNVAFSNDSGASFSQPVRLDQGNAIGRIDLELVGEETVLVSWMEGNKIVAAMVSMDGKIMKRYKLATSSDSWRSGFPQIARLSDSQVMIAWTDLELKKVSTAILNR